MERFSKILIILVLFSGLSLSGLAQSGKLIKADKNFSDFKYKEAIEQFLEIAKNGYKASSKEHVGSRLGDAYRLTNDPKNAETWYKIATESGTCEPVNFFYYAQVLRSNQKYDDAAVWLNKYLSNNPTDKAALNELAGFKDYARLMAVSNRIAVKSMDDVNSPMSDFSPAYYKNKIIFVSSRDSISVRRSSWTDQPFYGLYECEIDSNYKLVSYKRVFGDVNTKYHEGPVSYDKNTGILYFTRNNYFNNKKGESKDHTNFLKIYQAINKEGKWIDIKELPFNNDEYSCAHPAISIGSTKLYFISNMPGGYGGTDIYYVEKQGDGWGKPINAGEPLNTAGNELFLSFDDQGVLYFASNGHPGLGGLDIFSYSNGKVKNIGYPINTSFDDFGFATETGDKGFFTSNRKGGLNNDDLYYFKINQPPVAKNDKKFIEIVANKPVIDTAYLNILENDKDINNDIDSSSVLIISHSNKKSFVKTDNSGNMAYLPENGFRGIDTVQYVVFDKTKMSDTAFVFFNVFGKNPPVAKADYLTVEKNSKGSDIDLLKNDKDPDDNLTDRIEIVTQPEHGTIEVSKGFVNYIPEKNYKGKDFLVYRNFDQTDLSDEDTLFINVKMLFMGKEVTDNFELNLVINFETGKWDILPPAAKILDSVITVLAENPSVEIELGAHTDSRGSATANQTLSQKRAESSVNYIISKGIDKSRLVAIGYGESQLKNRCKDGVKCSQAEHAENRRVTIRITKY